MNFEARAKQVYKELFMNEAIGTMAELKRIFRDDEIRQKLDAEVYNELAKEDK